MAALQKVWNDNDADELLTSNGAKLFSSFQENAERVGAIVFKVSNIEAASAKIMEIIDDIGAKKVVSVKSDLEQALNLTNKLGDTKIELHYSNLKSNAESADAGITEMDFAIAETGSLVHDATNVQTRLVSSLPPVHIAIIKADKIVATVPDAIQLLYKEHGPDIPGYMAFISGPSRTADIERVLTIGVHGPEKLYIIAIS